MNNKVLVVIPTILPHASRSQLLDQLHQQEEVAAVIVVDNGNCFEVPAKKQEIWSKVEHIRPGCNLNWLHSNNYGAAIALERKVPFVCFLNDDVNLSPKFFKQLLQTFKHDPEAGVVVPQYTGSFGDRAFSRAKPSNFQPRDTETQVRWVDGTCMLISSETLQVVGLLDPCFRAPGWGSDVDYSHRVTESGRKLYVSHRAMLWHHANHGGLSARKVYGSRRKWIVAGMRQAKADLTAKYGPEWREVLPLPPNAYSTRPAVAVEVHPRSKDADKLE